MFGNFFWGGEDQVKLIRMPRSRTSRKKRRSVQRTDKRRYRSSDVVELIASQLAELQQTIEFKENVQVWGSYKEGS